MADDTGPDPLTPAQRILILRDHLEREKVRRREAEAKLRRITGCAEQWKLLVGDDPEALADAILAITGSEEGAPDGHV